jgi:arsenate reductase
MIQEFTYPKIEEQIALLSLNSIRADRKKVLQPLIDFVQEKTNQERDIRLSFICTHNSRRSHLSQIWSQTAAFHFGIKNIFCYSAGTEVTALFPMIAKTLESTGFNIKTIARGDNPIYSVNYAENQHPVICFSKIYTNDFNPKKEFAAILNCSQADGDCPFIAGAEKRISIPFEDPKVYDNTMLQQQKYKETSVQIATEMFYVFSQIKK